MKKIPILICALFFLLISNAHSAISEWKENESKGAKTRLLTSFYEDEKGEKKLIAGVEFEIVNGWKIYGHGSQGIGFPPEVHFEGASNGLQYEISWPQAEIEEEKIGSEFLRFSSYKKHVILPLEISAGQGRELKELALKINYGLCKDICIFATENFALPISSETDFSALQKIQEFFPKKIIKEQPLAKAEAVPPESFLKYKALISTIIFAIIGGAILNIMPCVLPVLSIKLISVINHSSAEISRLRFAFFSTIIGILSCFVIFSLLAAMIKITGNSIGWGLQFQNPAFITFLIVILTLFIASLIGLFEITFSEFLATILNKKISKSEERKNIFIPNFLSGILAVLLATPCSAPFLGSAISFALTQEFPIIFLIFLFIGVGFALPYFLLIISPRLISVLPKPGMWMVQVKQLMAGLLAATVIWLIYILSHNIGSLPAFTAAVISIAILSAFKIKSNFLRRVAISLLIAGMFFVPPTLQQYSISKEQAQESMWIAFDEMEIYRQVMKGKVVVVDITADWCLTCKFNKIRVFHDKEVMEKLKGGDIIAMRGDITKPDEEIMKFLHKHNRFAIPFNAVYGPNAKTGLLTSELLTKTELFELIDKAK